MNTIRPKAIELFSGAGFLGRAFREEGFVISVAYEFDQAAAETCNNNVARMVVVADLAMQRPSGDCQLLVAGPPCQGHSSIGTRTMDDPRNELALIIPRWARKTSAEVVVVENVPLFLRSVQFAELQRKMERAGFETIVWILNARDYGVAQNRLRAFSIFSKRGAPEMPKAQPSVTVREAFSSMPPFPRKSLQHFTLPQSKLAERRFRLVPEGGDIRDIAKRCPSLVPKSWYRTEGKVIDIWGRLRWDNVSNTVRTGFLNPSRGRFIHPEEHRPISFREGARLQMVPDDFHFVGKAEQICRQIGNGVPLGLGRAVAGSVRRLF